jgi:YesN/AraC family two-component response regulator
MNRRLQNDNCEYKILTVDDEPIVHTMIEHIIGECSLPVVLAGTATSGKEALEIAPGIQPDICLLDIYMSGMNGLELAERLPEVLGYKPRLIYLTAYDRFEYAQQAIRVGAMEYILKPIRRDDLIKALGRAVDALQAERIESIELGKLVQRLGPTLSTAASPACAKASRPSSMAKSARDYIDSHYAEELSLGSVAEHLNLSPGYLGSIFKSAYGLSFRAYLRAVRISKAKELMLDQRLNLGEISQAVGYDNLNYFSQAFLEETGVRPSEYRGGGRRWAK